MMQCKASTTLQILLLMSVLQKVCRGIDCYQCKSNEDKDCDTKSADPKYLRVCPSSHAFCRKLDFIYYFTESRDFVTVRECAMLSAEGTDCYRGRYSRDSYQRICECKDSGCNHSVNSIGRVSAVLTFSQLFVCWVLSCVRRSPQGCFFL